MKQFIVDRHTSTTPKMDEVPNEKIPIYDSLADVTADLANLTVGQIVVAKGTGLAQIITKNGQKKVIPLTTDKGTGLPVGFIAPVYKKGNYSGWLYLDGRDTTGTSEELSTHYPLLYAYLGSNVLPDYREAAIVGAEQNTTDTIATHDVYTEGQFKDDQFQNHKHSITDPGHTHNLYTPMASPSGSIARGMQYTVSSPSDIPGSKATTGITIGNPNSGSHGTVTRGKRKAVYFYIKATSGLSEYAQDNIVAQLNEERSYSTSEVNTGKKWIDGKPIYSKVVNVNALPNNAQTGYQHDIDDVDEFITIRGIAKSSTLSLPIPFVDRSGSTNIQLYASASGFTVSTNYDASSYAGKFIFEYTKTTD